MIFASQVIEYDVCQNATVNGANFTYSDSVSKLSATPNFCGNPVVSAVFFEEYNANVTDPLVLHSFAENNTGYISYDARMCQRDLAREEPYKLQIQLSYTNGSVSTLTSNIVDIKLNDPCEYTILPSQKFFASPFYSLQTFGDPLYFDLSDSYLADNATVWSG